MIHMCQNVSKESSFRQTILRKTSLKKGRYTLESENSMCATLRGSAKDDLFYKFLALKFQLQLHGQSQRQFMLSIMTPQGQGQGPWNTVYSRCRFARRAQQAIKYAHWFSYLLTISRSIDRPIRKHVKIVKLAPVNMII